MMADELTFLRAMIEALQRVSMKTTIQLEKTKTELHETKTRLQELQDWKKCATTQLENLSENCVQQADHTPESVEGGDEETGDVSISIDDRK